MPIQHLAPTLDALEEPWFLGPSMGPKYGRILEQKFDARPDKQAIDDALALGGYLVHTEANKRQRHALRAVLLANFLLKNQPVALKDRLRDQYRALSTDQLAQQFKHLVPAFIDNDNRPAWSPDNFTNPVMVRALHRPTDWTRNAVPPYTFLIHALKYPSEVLDAPIQTLSGWTAISMSVLSSSKPIAYSSFGIILRVPENNILTTSPTDQWFDNYAGTPQSTKARGQAMAKHIAEKTIKLGGLLTPDEVVQLQGTDAAMQHSAGAAQTPFNEVVVCGIAGQKLPHGMTGQLTLAGIFIQTKMDGKLPEHYMALGPTRGIELGAVACAKNYHVPLLYLPTSKAL